LEGSITTEWIPEQGKGGGFFSEVEGSRLKELVEDSLGFYHVRVSPVSRTGILGRRRGIRTISPIVGKPKHQPDLLIWVQPVFFLLVERGSFLGLRPKQSSGSKGRRANFCKRRRMEETLRQSRKG